MQYDVILWFIMFTLWFFNRNYILTRLPVLILTSNLISLWLSHTTYEVYYYLLEGLRHISTVVLIYYLFIKERYTEYYFSYFLVYIGITTLYLTGLFVVLSDIDIDTIGVALNTLEFMVFIYGILFIKSHPSCSDGR